MPEQPRVLLVCSDLFFSTQLKGRAESAGAAVDVELSPGRVAERVSGGDYSHIVLDLESAGLNVAGLLDGLSAEGRPEVIAFGPHVQTARLEAARAAGCDHVVSRGQIASSLALLLG